MLECTCWAPYPLNADVHSFLSRLDHSISCDNGRRPPNDQQNCTRWRLLVVPTERSCTMVAMHPFLIPRLVKS